MNSKPKKKRIGNNKGFTLVELLAVIVIIAVIAIIATPTLLIMIENSRKGSAESSALSYTKAVENAVLKNLMTVTSEDYNGSYAVDGLTITKIKTIDGENISENPIKLTVELKGEQPNGNEDIVTIKNNEVTYGQYTFGKYKITYFFEGGTANYCSATGDAYPSCDGNFQDSIINGNYKDVILNGADPVLGSNIIPIKISADGTVTKADITKKWYDYSNKEWANAVILVDKTKTYNNGETIPENNIQSYFVWIPRFKYKIFDLGNYTGSIASIPTESIAKTIDIVFETKNKAISNGTKVGEYLTHPAFTSFDTNGMWVGKFETGYLGATSTATSQVNSSTSNKIIIKPNVYSWRGITASNAFIASINYNSENVSHMMKNTEWGAASYLSHSEYGINTEININNNSNYLTGYSAALGTDQSSYTGTSGTESSVTLGYNNNTGYKASTTGNITGIYDMSGGAWEYMAAYINGKLGSSGFTTSSIAKYDSKYFDVYSASSTVTSYNERILGDATGEMGPFYSYKDKDGTTRYHNNWYADYSEFPDSNSSWFRRGGNFSYGALAGQFSTYRGAGGAVAYIGYRVILSPLELE